MRQPQFIRHCGERNDEAIHKLSSPMDLMSVRLAEIRSQ